MTLSVNGEKIDNSVIELEAERMRPHYEQVFAEMDNDEREGQLLEWSRENVVERVLLRQEAQNRDITIEQNEIESALENIRQQYTQQSQGKVLAADEAESMKREIELQMKVERLLNDVTKDVGAPSEEAVSEFYEQNKDRFTTPERVRVAHIVKHIDGHTDEAAAQEMMEKVHDELKTGAVFEMLVSKYSDCPDNGGDLGYFERGHMVEEFEDVVFNLGVGQMSDIFRTRFGFHVAKLYDRKASAIQPLDEVRQAITEELGQQMRSGAVDEFVDKLKEEAAIEQA